MPRTNSLQETRRWWIRLLLQPLLFLAGGAVLLTALGVAQRTGWISSGHVGHLHDQDQMANGNVQYICPMMCTPPQSEPGRCPVCDMELVPASSGSGPADSQSIRLTPAARRVANIQTVTVRSESINRTIRAVGQLSYDEGRLKAISAYVDGRIERLYADYTGIVVKEGDHLALVYSPRLYSAQVE
ncbi:MAG: efflux RND transporter periplasmic adaptor subunit, partial [Planctomycetaceae bacterium]|nr:efflux RND transporter periplasmic adaptor subunit [Planctomycetaceae bacterium]